MTDRTDRVEEYACRECSYHTKYRQAAVMHNGDTGHRLIIFRAEQPQQAIAPIGHRANCRCCESLCSDTCDDTHTHHPYTDPLCLPSLLREAEVRLEGMMRGLPNAEQKHECYTIRRLRGECDEARAAVDRLRGKS